MAPDQMHKTVFLGLLALAAVLWVLCSGAVAEPGGRTGAQAAYYFDSRGFNTLTLVSSTDGLPLGTSVWGFVDLHSAFDSADRQDMTRYFAEYRLARALDPDWIGGVEGVGLVAEYNDLDGGGNALVRLGASYRRTWGPWRTQLRLFPWESDGDGWQAALSYGLTLGPRLQLGGFIDYNRSLDGPDRWVAEPQLTLRLDPRFALLLELRYNGFEPDESGAALGLEVTF